MRGAEMTRMEVNSPGPILYGRVIVIVDDDLREEAIWVGLGSYSLFEVSRSRAEARFGSESNSGLKVTSPPVHHR